jgi:chromosome segregation ATPase
MDYRSKTHMLSSQIAGLQSQINGYVIELEERENDVAIIKKAIEELKAQLEPLQTKLEIMLS